MNLNASRARLEMLTKGLLLQWSETQNCWSDAKASEFERQFLQDLEAQATKAAGLIDSLSELFARIEHDCE